MGTKVGSKVQHCCHYPQFTVQQGGAPTRCSMHNAARIIAEGGTLEDDVVESDGSTRKIFENEQQQIAEAAVEWQQQA